MTSGHRVEAERNIKEAVLRLDKVHREARSAPPQGHTHLQLFSQLFVGKQFGRCLENRSLVELFYLCNLIYLIPYNVLYLIIFVLLKLFRCLRGQRGFLGCIRSLKVNGVTLDLEGGQRSHRGEPGCSGHCSSYGMHCQNEGKCIEKYNGYLCDCSLTAFDGAFLQWWYGHLSYVIST